MGKLKKKTDIENCSNASPFFGHLLREKREKKVVLPTVLEILAKDYCAEENAGGSTLFLFLKWRLVCKKWNWAIEELHQNEDNGHYWGPNRFEKESKVDKFLGHFETTQYSAVGHGRVSKKCPFFARSVHVDYFFLWAKNKRAFFNGLKEMFQKYGDQVWYFKFSWKYRYERHDNVDFYHNVKEMVELMPNLKVLRVERSNFSFSYGEPNPLELLVEEIERNPFPRLTKLEMICFDGTTGVLHNHLVNRNQQISRLEIINVNFNGYWLPVLPINLPNLNHLSLVDDDTNDVLNALKPYPFTLNLERFALSLRHNCPFIRWSSLFNLLGSKINSCTQLELQMKDPESFAERMSILQDSLKCRLPLANIQRLKIDSSCTFFLDFLLTSENTLREMEIFCHQDVRNTGRLKRKQVVKFLEFENKMEQSNIAEVLPRLKKLTVEISRPQFLGKYYYIVRNGVVKAEKVVEDWHKLWYDA